MRFLQILTTIYPVFIAIKNWAEQVIRPSLQAAISHVKIPNILRNFLPRNNRQKITAKQRSRFLNYGFMIALISQPMSSQGGFFIIILELLNQLEVMRDDDLVFTKKTASNRRDEMNCYSDTFSHSYVSNYNLQSRSLAERSVLDIDCPFFSEL